jgi:predicted molibdopterin-dependent oxidoreductase YjgC
MAAQSEGGRFLIEVDGRAVEVEPGQTVAAALLAAGIFAFRRTLSGEPRGIFCGMGVCFDCLVTINGLPDQRACLITASPAMRVKTSAAPLVSPEVSGAHR